MKTFQHWKFPQIAQWYLKVNWSLVMFGTKAAGFKFLVTKFFAFQLVGNFGFRSLAYDGNAHYRPGGCHKTGQQGEYQCGKF
ncbi:MAG: hypothetical protein ABI977_00855 [Acidobacteriota bacterium]